MDTARAAVCASSSSTAHPLDAAHEGPTYEAHPRVAAKSPDARPAQRSPPMSPEDAPERSKARMESHVDARGDTHAEDGHDMPPTPPLAVPLPPSPPSPVMYGPTRPPGPGGSRGIPVRPPLLPPPAPPDDLRSRMQHELRPTSEDDDGHVPPRADLLVSLEDTLDHTMNHMRMKVR